jgi:hypothetical protein
MSGESPLSMMHEPQQRLRRPVGRLTRRRSALRPAWMAALGTMAVVALALVWVWLWYYAAQVADRTLAGWVERETAAGRIYSCASQTMGGFPFGIEVQCTDPAATLNHEAPPYSVKAKTLTVTAQVYRPTVMVADVTGPLTLAQMGQPPSFLGTWSRARMSVRGLPPNPDGFAATFDRLRIDRADPGAQDAGEGAIAFKADHADLRGRVISGSARDKPVIEMTLHLSAATAPGLHALTAEPTDAEVDAVLRGFKDLAPKPWVDRWREMQAAGGGLDIKFVRITQPDAIIVGTGKLALNAQGRLDGLLKVAIVGIEHIVPLLGVDRLIGRGVARLTGSGGASAQGLGALDQLLPGLTGVVRESANASVIESLKKIGERTEIDNKPALVVPLRFADGAIYLGMLRLGELPPLF